MLQEQNTVAAAGAPATERPAGSPAPSCGEAEVGGANAAAEVPTPRAGWQAFRRDLGTLPNLVSLGRIVGIYLAMGLYLGGLPVIGLIVGLAAGLSDYVDGILARRLKQVTPLGALLDQLGDMLMESSCILLAVVMGAWHPIFLFLYLFRNFTNISVRMAATLHGQQIPSVFLGKMGANFNFYAILLVFVALSGLIPAPAAHLICWLSGAGLAIGLLWGYVSMGIYLRRYIEGYVRG